MTWEIFCSKNICLPIVSVCIDVLMECYFSWSEEIRKSGYFRNCQNILILGVDLCLESGIFLNSALGNQGDRYLAKYRLNLLGMQLACLRPGRSEAVSSPSDTGDWIIQSNVHHTQLDSNGNIIHGTTVLPLIFTSKLTITRSSPRSPFCILFTTKKYSISLHRSQST